ncbi:MAG: DUF167 domain-containing protein [Rickettsiales bacterium]|jgi:uncharacterized protein YggU (UPF0235/DUF167 family)|nr:DUF167 domain-containing protein [Rickettsiales bacterium]
MQINVRVIPKAKLNKITVGDDGNYKIHTTTAPEDGKANEAVIRLLADHLGLPRSKIKLVRGDTSRDKVFTTQD